MILLGHKREGKNAGNNAETGSKGSHSLMKIVIQEVNASKLPFDLHGKVRFKGRNL
jgi:hypothetical protein